MSQNTYTQLIYHLFWSTKNLKPFLTPLVQESLFPYLNALIRENNGIPLATGGHIDHVHILYLQPQQHSLSHVARNLKANSSRWLRQNLPDYKSFAWQEGYSAFSVSPSQKEKVQQFIKNQDLYHKNNSFEQELMGILQKHHIDCPCHYLFNSISIVNEKLKNAVW